MSPCFHGLWWFSIPGTLAAGLYLEREILWWF